MKLTNPCSCDACSAGCNYGSGALTKDQIPKIAEFLKISEEELKKKYLEVIERFNTKLFRPKILRKGKPYGKCIFFTNDKKCKIHDVKPLECKISMGCKLYGEKLSLWFMLNYFVNKNDEESIRQYKSYLKNEGKTLN